MPRSPVVTTIATREDIPRVMALWDELRAIGGRAERAVTPPVVADVEERFLDLFDTYHCRVVLCSIDDEPAGMAVIRTIHPDPMSDEGFVYIAHLVVMRGKRQRGVGHALIHAATDFAIERGVDYVGVGVYPTLRDASRFYARLGFAPAALHRVAPVHVLRRRMGKDRQQPVALSDLVRRGRSIRSLPPQRRRRPAEPIDNAS
ncbi:MAG TPA: GNAT family N-acetyltransferase [Mycobacteriales bacterium]|nr:GNAT family N-acetyltransferase [Mycobacteriales bacterium]